MRVAYVVGRLGQALLAVAGTLVVTFVMIQLAPGDALDALGGRTGNPATDAYLRSLVGFDRPPHEQLVSYLGHLVRGDLGYSIVQNRPVTVVIAERVRPTLLLAATALVASIAGGVALGIAVARRPHGAFDLGASAGALVGSALPGFWLAQLAVFALAFRFRIFPASGMTDARVDYTGVANLSDIGYHLVLPALVLALSELTLVFRVTRAGMLKELRSDYARTARAKGLPEQLVASRHALNNALLPVITIVGSRAGQLFSGAVMIETVFGWPGLGTTLVDAARNQDGPLLLGIVLFVSFSLILANLLADLAYARVDPRISYR